MTEDFGVKDMLILLNNKVDEVLQMMNTKADHSEVIKLRDRMHKVEGRGALITYLAEQLQDLKKKVAGLEEHAERIEASLVTEEAVKAALKKQRDEQRNTLRWAVGFLGSIGVGNIIIQAIQG